MMPRQKALRLAAQKRGARGQQSTAAGDCSDEIERIHRGILDLKHIEAVSDPMRELIDDLMAGAGTQARAEETARVNACPSN